MDYDDIVIGSGLAALGTVLGLPERRRVLVIGGPASGQNVYYGNAGGGIPCAYLGFGGLGNFWHGVIPTAGRGALRVDQNSFATLSKYFFPNSGLAERLGQAYYFVPWCAIRPAREWLRLQSSRGSRLAIVNEFAEKFRFETQRFVVQTCTGTHAANRLWIAAGALHTPRFLDASLGSAVSRGTVSDHVLCYLGQINRWHHPERPAPWVQHNRDGVWFQCTYDAVDSALYTMRPARFGYAKLDYGIQQRRVFGLPTGGALEKILRSGSAGLVAEALYNRFGLFPDAKMQSAYVQIQVKDAYSLSSGQTELRERSDIIQAAITGARSRAPWKEMILSRFPQVFIPVIHLHNSVDVAVLQSTGFGCADSKLRVVDASAVEDIGPEHHSFKMMVSAYAASRSSS